MGPLLPFETSSTSKVVIGILHIVHATQSHESPTDLHQEKFHRFIAEALNIDHYAERPQLLLIFHELYSACVRM